jgi:hypothetical protein
MRTCFLLLFACTLCSWSALADEAADKAALAKFENDFGTILARNDGIGFDEKLTPDWKMILSDGTVMTRDELLRSVKSGKLKFTAHSVAELDVRVYGDAAVVIGVGNSKGTWESEPFDGKDRFTDVFIRKDGKWVCVSSHSSDLAEGK